MGDSAPSLNQTNATNVQQHSSSNAIANPIQRLYDAAMKLKDVSFEVLDNALEDNSLAECMDAMEHVTLEHLGFTLEHVESTREMISMNIIEEEKFHIAVFLLPKGAVIPLHDHPNMAVCSKIICGSLKVRAYSQMPRTSMPKGLTPADCIAKQTMDCSKSARDAAWLLTPSFANVHRFEATEPCVILDLLLPPYSEPDRPCTFYVIKKKNNMPRLQRNGSDNSMETQNSPKNKNESNNVSAAEALIRTFGSDVKILTAIPEEVADVAIELPITVDYHGIVPVSYEHDDAAADGASDLPVSTVTLVDEVK